MGKMNNKMNAIKDEVLNFTYTRTFLEFAISAFEAARLDAKVDFNQSSLRAKNCISVKEKLQLR